MGLRRHQIPPLVYSSSRMGFGHTFSVYVHVCRSGTASFLRALFIPFFFLINGRSLGAAVRHRGPSAPTK